MRAETKLQRNLRTMFAHRGFRTVAVPNGATLRGDKTERAIQMANLKRDGLCVGFPDLIVFADGGRVGFVEVKCEGEKLRDTQVEVQGWLTSLGHKHAVCRSPADVDETLTAWGWA